MLVYLGFEVVPEKKLHGVKSGEHGGHPMLPRRETTCPGNISLRIPSERRDVWVVTPSSWNLTFSAPCSSKRSSSLGRRKFSSIAQYRSGVTVTVTSFSSKKYGPHTPNSKNGTPHSNLRAVEWLLVKFPTVNVRPVSEILFVDCAWKVEMWLVRKQQNSCTGNVLKEFSTQSCTGFTISLTQFLCNHNFVGVHPEISMQNSPNTSIR
jgi:hypothetical protein